MAQRRERPKKTCTDTPGTDGCELICTIDDDYIKAHLNHNSRFNEKNELSRRYEKFNLQQLVKIAVKACNGSQSCIKVTKCSEGLHNKAFILIMDSQLNKSMRLKDGEKFSSYRQRISVLSVQGLRGRLSIFHRKRFSAAATVFRKRIESPSDQSTRSLQSHVRTRNKAIGYMGTPSSIPTVWVGRFQVGTHNMWNTRLNFCFYHGQIDGSARLGCSSDMFGRRLLDFASRGIVSVDRVILLEVYPRVGSRFGAVHRTMTRSYCGVDPPIKDSCSDSYIGSNPCSKEEGMYLHWELQDRYSALLFRNSSKEIASILLNLSVGRRCSEYPVACFFTGCQHMSEYD